MGDRDVALDQAIRDVATILGDALVHLLFLNPPVRPADFPETESPHVTAG